jgi:hypothetical protein
MRDGRALLARYDHEERYSEALNKEAEPLVMALHPGENLVGILDYRILVRYLLLDQEAETRRAIARGRFSMGDITIIRKRRKSQAHPGWEPKR